MSRGALTRRSFLTTTAAAGAALLAQPAQALRHSAPVRVSCIGFGRRGEALARLCAQVHGLQIAAVYDAHHHRCESAAAEFGARSCTSFSEAISYAQAVIIATPDHLHGPQTLAALRAGKHVYLEPPLSLDLDQARQIAALAHKTGLAVQVGLDACSDPLWQRAGALWRTGALGELRLAQYHSPQIKRGAPGEASSELRPHEIDWRSFDAGGRDFESRRFLQWRGYAEYCDGPAVAQQLEALVLLSQALRPAQAQRISAVGGVFAHPDQPQLDALMTSIDDVKGGRVELRASPMNGDLAQVFRGRLGSIRLQGRRLHVDPDSGAAESLTLAPAPPTAHLDNWLTAIRGEGECTCPPGTVLTAQELIAAAVASAHSGRAVHV